jgi:glycosyltransferase involved in cell wall biosynthesis
MPTANRREFVRQSLLSFRLQTWPAAELVVVDDGRDPVADLCSGCPNVTYVRLDRPVPSGTKLNIGIAQARGELIQKWDDDDYHGPEFLSTAAAHLQRAAAARPIVVWDCFLVLLVNEKGLRHSGCGWQAGGTMCFHRELWERVKFREVTRSDDSWFLKDQKPSIVPVCAPEQYIVVRHGRNTWQRMEDGSAADEYFWNLPVYPAALESVVHREQVSFYRGLSVHAGRRIWP